MVVLIAPDSFKGSLTAQEAADAMREGVLDVLPSAETILHPLSDGGEGMLDILLAPMGGEARVSTVAGPMPGQRVDARWGYVAGTASAMIEMAQAAGLGLVPAGRRNPLIASTQGVGDLIRGALAQGARTFLVGIGGSATNDGGAGMARALGVRFLDAEGRELPPGGAALASLASVDLSGLDARVGKATFTVACDVRNPLCGPEGASATFGPQKGARPEDVALLDAALERYRQVVLRDLGTDVQAIPGSGAAGGLGAGLVVFCNARLLSGIDVILDRTGFDAELAAAGIVLTGEGRVDQQTRFGKVLSGVRSRARRTNVVVAAVVGDITGDRGAYVGPDGFDDLEVLVDAHTSPAEAMHGAKRHLRAKTATLFTRLLHHHSHHTLDRHAAQ